MSKGDITLVYSGIVCAIFDQELLCILVQNVSRTSPLSFVCSFEINGISC